MPVYEATDNRHFSKIVAFLKRQPETSLPFRCWTIYLPQVDAEYLRRVVEQDELLHVFWGEDAQNEVRAVIAVERRPEAHLVTHALLCVDNQDYEDDNPTYYNELCDWLVRNKCQEHGITKGEFWALAKYKKWAQNLWGKAMGIRQEIDHPIFGKSFFYVLDIPAYLGGK